MLHIISRFCCCPKMRIVATTLVALVWSSFAFCDEIHDAARDGNLAVVQRLLNKNPNLVSTRNTNDVLPLQYAIVYHHKEVAELLLAHHADPNASATNASSFFSGFTPLHMAVYYDFKDEAELLLKYHADINWKDVKGWTPLHLAVHRWRADFVELLLTNKADINPKDNDGNTPLHLAASFGPADFIDLLISHHADINATNNIGQTPLHLTVENEVAGEKSANLLLASGADVNIKDDQGQTPLQLAESSGKKTIAELLRQHGGH